jgi:uncharacterized membrane protein
MQLLTITFIVFIVYLLVNQSFLTALLFGLILLLLWRQHTEIESLKIRSKKKSNQKQESQSKYQGFHTDEAAMPFAVQASRHRFDDKPQQVPSLQKQPTPCAKKSESQQINKLLAIFLSFFTQGNTIVRVGAVILFIGIGFLLKYSASYVHFTITAKLILILIGSLSLFLIGWFLRKSRPQYAQILQGAALGIKYITIFAGFYFYHLIHILPAFLILVGLSAFTIFCALWQNSSGLILLSFLGGFLAPVLIQLDTSELVGFYSYYLALNIGVFYLSMKKSWRLLTWLGFLFTFVIAALSGYFHYQANDYIVTQFALIAFWALYIAINLNLTKKLHLKEYIDITLTIGPAIMGFAIQMILVKNFIDGQAIASLTTALVYSVLALALHYFKMNTNLVLSYRALATIFITITIPLWLNPESTVPIWAIEGALIVWLGHRQQQPLAIGFGALLQLVTGIWALYIQLISPPILAWTNPYLLSNFLIAIAGFTSSFYLQKNPDPRPCWGFFIWATLFWLYAGLSEIYFFAPISKIPAFEFSFIVISSSIAWLIFEVINWDKLRFALPMLVVYMLFRLCENVYLGITLFANFLWLAWILGFSLSYVFLKRSDKLKLTLNQTLLHKVTYWLLSIVITLCIYQKINPIDHQQYRFISLLLLPTLLQAVIHQFKAHWPFSTHDYLKHVSPPLIVWLCIYTVIIHLLTPSITHFYLPIANPLALSIIFSLFVITLYLKKRFIDRYQQLSPSEPRIILGALYFIALNGILFRVLHFYGGIAYNVNAFYNSALTQTTLSIFWTLIALIMMIYASRKNQRILWQISAGLIGVVVIKLFFIDFTGIATLERIISFIAVGLLLLLIGYIAPLPNDNANKN